MEFTLKGKELKSYVNWNYIGIAAAILSVSVAVYNIYKYSEKISE